MTPGHYGCYVFHTRPQEHLQNMFGINFIAEMGDTLTGAKIFWEVFFSIEFFVFFRCSMCFPSSFCIYLYLATCSPPTSQSEKLQVKMQLNLPHPGGRSKEGPNIEQNLTLTQPSGFVWLFRRGQVLRSVQDENQKVEKLKHAFGECLGSKGQKLVYEFEKNAKSR